MKNGIFMKVESIVEWSNFQWKPIFCLFLSGSFTQVLLYTNTESNGPGLDVIRLEYSIKLKMKSNDWLLANTCPQAANHCA